MQQASSSATHWQETSTIQLAIPGCHESKLVEDKLSADDHAKLDDEILKYQVPWILHQNNPERRSYCHFILQRLLVQGGSDSRKSGGLATKFSDQYPWLSQLVDECWRQRSFRTIRCLQILQPLQPSKSDSAYNKLLDRSLQPNQAYKLVDVPDVFTSILSKKNREEARRRFTALAGPEDAHNYKYETKKLLQGSGLGMTRSREQKD